MSDVWMLYVCGDGCGKKEVKSRLTLDFLNSKQARVS
jgi:hypothetical protein